ncbi:protein of unknown function (plasmid) [Cupriavidus taiwanensis]|uniref:Uncharacterized protein n=1 Tax=Cupriavidus taiwanensis TaxID=164546 RepID=A0A375HED7_9BURK|nr:protein of unknown function [Cupriavidus taiwanensis]SOZ72438.1 protein of unknown function [Cupriavidus taiwanensis]SOZ74831.1 protein of unknown function [Cupriavidus taiwanensis]SPA11538.1 protein of unknown function [Cupriavidus taiwanensis]SPD49276.1 protein of unknown function [Cupriavidus taiwanensis]
MNIRALGLAPNDISFGAPARTEQDTKSASNLAFQVMSVIAAARPLRPFVKVIGRPCNSRDASYSAIVRLAASSSGNP